eukprot:GHVU01082029.1.p1 GENE.GHVU01082029.1~~GHVU01082029.1.p1  ORF type:complete len:162 (-),score=15.69 GHVU01082029.1:32-517(-)
MTISAPTAFLDDLIATVDGEYPPFAVATMDEFSLPRSWQLPQMTVALFCSSDGSKGAPFAVITGCRSGEPQPPAGYGFPPGMVVKSNREGWMSSAMMMEWLEEPWGTTGGVPYHSNQPTVLILDSFCKHTLPAVRQRTVPARVALHCLCVYVYPPANSGSF